MMNRRLRERLTEEEILQVFVDVCEVSRPIRCDEERWRGPSTRLSKLTSASSPPSYYQGVAKMHSLSPPLIHRDLKVRPVFLRRLRPLSSLTRSSSRSLPSLSLSTLPSLSLALSQVENILQSGANLFKLCDFGSVAVSHPPPSSMAEMREVELDINTHTTMQYRAPEMVDVYQRRVIDEKSGEYHPRWSPRKESRGGKGRLAEEACSRDRRRVELIVAF